ncbi:MAG: hypothetical protein Q4F24_13725 [Eubacteriales bacterium]|nr:hypothetical protein [Eubacteriales bacterium]
MKQKKPYPFPTSVTISLEDSLPGTSMEQAIRELIRLCPPTEIPVSTCSAAKSILKPHRQRFYDAQRLEYSSAEICGLPALFTLHRIDTDTIPDGIYRYEISGCDDIYSTVKIAPDILTNFLGTLLVAENLISDCQKCRVIPPGDLDVIGRSESLDEWRFLYGI